eukprot:349702-Chlamydomonas_euryale.AAC.2
MIPRGSSAVGARSWLARRAIARSSAADGVTASAASELRCCCSWLCGGGDGVATVMTSRIAAASPGSCSWDICHTGGQSSTLRLGDALDTVAAAAAAATVPLLPPPASCRAWLSQGVEDKVAACAAERTSASLASCSATAASCSATAASCSATAASNASRTDAAAAAALDSFAALPVEPTRGHGRAGAVRVPAAPRAGGGAPPPLDVASCARRLSHSSRSRSSADGGSAGSRATATRAAAGVRGVPPPALDLASCARSSPHSSLSRSAAASACCSSSPRERCMLWTSSCSRATCPPA